jgi:hypothetical protein
MDKMPSNQDLVPWHDEQQAMNPQKQKTPCATPLFGEPHGEPCEESFTGVYSLGDCCSLRAQDSRLSTAVVLSLQVLLPECKNFHKKYFYLNFFDGIFEVRYQSI